MSEQDPVLNVAARWALRFGMAPSTFRACVTSAERRELEHASVTFRGRHRRVVLRRAPARAGARRGLGPPDPAAVDAWAASPSDLEARTRSATTCTPCTGTGRRTCDDCEGSGVCRCASCDGTGVVVSDRTRQRAACGPCRGSGTRSCACVDGKRSCSSCAGSGSVEAWLAITESPFERRATAGSPHAEHGDEVTRWTGQPRDAPAEVKGWLDRLQPKLREGERVDVVTVEVRRAQVVDVTAAVAGLPAVVRVGGEGVLDAVPTAFVARALLIATAVGAFAAWSAAVWLAYSLRHHWFAVSHGSLVLVLVGGCLAVLAGLAAAEWCVPGLRMIRRAALAALTGAALVTQAGAAGSGAPSMGDAERALAAGDEDAAVSEAAACAELGIDTVRARALLDQVSLAAVEREPDLLNAARLAAGPFHDEALRTRAQDSVRTRMVSQISADQSAGDWSSTQPLLAALRQQDRVLPAVVALLAAHALHRLEECIGRLDAACATTALADAEALGAPQDSVADQRGSADRAAREKAAPDWDVIRSRKAPLARRAQACDSARAPVAFAAAAGTSAFRPTAIELEATCAQVAADIEAERLRVEAATAAAARREEQARVRAEERARRAEAAASAAWAPLVCADGTLSPSCVCGGSHRGCCSHHGGVAGCSR